MAVRVTALLAMALVACAVPARAQRCAGDGEEAPVLRPGQVVAAELDAGDATLEGDRFDGRDPCTGRPFEPFFYQARAGERVVLTLESLGPDMTLTVASGYRHQAGAELGRGRAHNGSVTVRVTSPVAARLLVQAESNVSRGRPGAYGRFRVTVRSEGGAAAAAPSSALPVRSARSAVRTLHAGSVESGELAEGDARLPDDSRYDDFVYVARAGEQIQVRLSSDAFDPFLYVGERGPGAPLLHAVSDDDSGGGTTALVTYTARAAGPVVIRANSLMPGQTGRYTLRVQSIR